MKRRSSRELSQGVASSIPARGSNSLHIDIPPMGSQAVSRETSRQSPVPIPGEQSSSSQASATSWHCFFPFFQSKFKHDYVHVHKSNKSVMEFNRLKHIQTYSSHIGPIWCMKFSHDGRFLATGGMRYVLFYFFLFNLNNFFLLIWLYIYVIINYFLKINK